SLESLLWEKWPVGSERHVQEWESILELENGDFGGMATILESSPTRLMRHELALELIQSKAPSGNEEFRLQGYRYGSGRGGKGFVRWFSIPTGREKETLHEVLIQKIIWLIQTQVPLKGSLADHTHQPWHKEYARMGSKSTAPIYRHQEFFRLSTFVSRSDYQACYEEGNCPRYHDESDSDENLINLGLSQAERYCEWRGGHLPQPGSLWWYHLHYDEMPFRSINERKSFQQTLSKPFWAYTPSTPVLTRVGSDQVSIVEGSSHSKASIICVKGNPDWELKEHLEQWLAELLANRNFSKASRISEFIEISGLTKPQWPFSDSGVSGKSLLKFVLLGSAPKANDGLTELFEQT
ncbi:MAG: hypothetical protein V1269_18220, partial [Deltaproteobacteria bacterium]|nr:hypothetical protein [Deltaproteobacteria bacterium]